MTRRALWAGALAGALSVVLHAGGLIAFAPAAPQLVADGPAQLAMLGNSFEDAAIGRLTPLEPIPDPAPRPKPVPAEPVAVAAALPSPAVVPLATRALPQTQANPVLAATPPNLHPSPAAPLPERIIARPEAQNPDPDTPRPQTRPAQTRPQTPRPETPRTDAPPPVPQGQADQASRAGQSAAAPTGNAPASATGGTAQGTGTSREVAAYPQEVNRHLSRLRRPNTRFEGAAVVAFTIAPGGGLAAIAVARSSGNAEFDQLALSHIQRAAPFPPPPSGAQRSFNVTVQGR